jgi:kynurenine 3-monooxygenase
LSAPKQRFTVLGAGLGGALMAVYLGRAGYEVLVIERRPDARKGPGDRGRSINLAISTRGIHALGQVGLADQVLAMAVPMRGRMVHALDGHLAFHPYSPDGGQCLNSVSRQGLNNLLLDAAEALPDVRLHFGMKCEGVDLDAGTATVEGAATGASRTTPPGILIGADGAFSAVRREMQRLDRFDYSQTWEAYGYKELTMPAAGGGRHALPANALHIWPRGGYMLIALPNAEGSFTCTLFWPLEGPSSFASVKTAGDVARFFESSFPDAVSLMPGLAEDYFANPTGSLVTVRCRPWRYRDRVVLLGDACHAVVPFYGQGANAAFEDCVVLDECLRAHAPDVAAAFEAYEVRRKEDVDALANLALANFVEMRDTVASTRFHLMKRLEHALHRAFPTWFVPLYSMVTFSRTPYAEAVRRAERQWKVVRWAAGAGALLLLLLMLSIVV